MFIKKFVLGSIGVGEGGVSSLQLGMLIMTESVVFLGQSIKLEDELVYHDPTLLLLSGEYL